MLQPPAIARRSGTIRRVEVAVDDEHANRNHRTPESTDHGAVTVIELLPPSKKTATANSSPSVATLRSERLQASSRTCVSLKGAWSLCRDGQVDVPVGPPGDPMQVAVNVDGPGRYLMPRPSLYQRIPHMTTSGLTRL